MPDQLFAQPEDVFKNPTTESVLVGNKQYVSYTPPPVDENDYLLAASGIAAAFLAFRYLISLGLNEENIHRREQVESALAKVQEAAMPQWIQYADPAVGIAARVVNEKIESNFTEAYSEYLGGYITETSSAALLEGLTAAINAGIERIRAWEIAAGAYGLDSNQMRQYITAVIKEEAAAKDAGYNPRTKVKPSDILLDKLIMSRAEKIGSNEAYAIAQLSTITSYQASEYRGELQDGLRRWNTAQDEKVCSICGPLDGVEVSMFEPFVVAGKQVWAPGVHPNCRCVVSILYPSMVITKAMPGDPYDRDRKGRFSNMERRRPAAPNQFNVARQNAAVARQLAETFDLPERENLPEAPEVETNPFLVPTTPVTNPFEQQSVNPFETTGNPFEQVVNPFEVQNQIGNPFEQVNPFTQVANPFDTAQQQVVRKKIIRIIRIAGQEIEVPVNGEETEDGKVKPPKTLQRFEGYMFGGNVESQLYKLGISDDLLVMGQVIDLDEIPSGYINNNDGMPFHPVHLNTSQFDPRALALATEDAQLFIQAKKAEMENNPIIDNMRDDILFNVDTAANEEVMALDPEELIDMYSGNHDDLVHIYLIYRRYADGRDMSSDEIDEIEAMSADQVEQMLIDDSRDETKVWYIQHALFDKNSGRHADYYGADAAVASAGATIADEHMHVLFEFTSFTGDVEKSQDFDLGFAGGKYEVVGIRNEKLSKGAIEDVEQYYGLSSIEFPKQFRVITLVPTE